jgi:hypothetical protein
LFSFPLAKKHAAEAEAALRSIVPTESRWDCSLEIKLQGATISRSDGEIDMFRFGYLAQ